MAVSERRTPSQVGSLVREWRERRRLSQVDLANQAGVSARHISFLETGRAMPSRAMVLRLAEQLDVPMRDRNPLLLAAGYAPVYEQKPLADPAMGPVLGAVRQVLRAHDPNPALVVDGESKAPGRPKLDLIGMILVTAALVALCLPLIEGRQQGWPTWSWILLVGAVPLFTVFAVQQNRLRGNGGSPSVDLSLFRERAFTAGLFARLTFFASMASYFLVLALYLQKGRLLEPLDSGLVFGALGLGYIITSMSARKFAARFGPQTNAVGCVIRLVGMGLQIWAVSSIGVHDDIGWLIPGLFLGGAGMGLAIAPLASTVLARVPAHHAGSASGVTDHRAAGRQRPRRSPHRSRLLQRARQRPRRGRLLRRVPRLPGDSGAAYGQRRVAVLVSGRLVG
ncbi:MFS transporter [Streptomyces sp. NPDC001315]|uniref:MFS transporter n=1 Tax=Streptomyces sp. NPDC001315 TaxID=3364562 RepID=UPI00368453FD